MSLFNWELSLASVIDWVLTSIPRTLSQYDESGKAIVPTPQYASITEPVKLRWDNQAMILLTTRVASG